MAMPRIEPALPVICALLSILVFAYMPLEEPAVRNLTGNKGWFALTQEFYEASSLALNEHLSKNPQVRLRLLPERNETTYLISSPCNEGLVANFTANGQRENVPLVYFKGPVERRGQAAQSRGYWLDDKGRLLSRKAVAELGKTTQACQIVFHTVEMLQDTVQARLLLLIDGQEVVDRKVLGSTEQLRWFLRSPSHEWMKWLPLFVLLLISFITYLCWSKYFKGQDNLYAEFWMALACIFGAVLAALFFNNVFWYDRASAKIHEPTNVFILVDRNSEAFFPASFKKEAACGPRFLTRIICDEIGAKLTGEKRSAKASFYEYLLEYLWLDEIYEKKSYELNQRFRCVLHFVSGREGSETKPLVVPPAGTASYLTKGLYRFTASKREYLREGRLVIAAEVIKELKRVRAKGRPVALLFTSQCAPYKEDVHHFLKNLHTVPSHKAPRVFTVLLPTIPRTGEFGIEHFEEGKTLFAAMSSDLLVLTNKKKVDLAAAKKQLQSSFKKYCPLSFKMAKVKEFPLFDLPNLGLRHRPYWDEARNLQKERERLLSLVGAEEKARQQGAAIASAFLQFAAPESSAGLARDNRVHVLSASPFAILLLLTLCLFLALFYSSVGEEYNLAFRDALRNDKAMWFWQIVYLLGAALALLLAFFLLLWRRSDGLIFAFPGCAQSALLGLIILWCGFFMQPFFVFRLWLYSRRVTRRKALLVASIMTIAISLALLIVNEQSWSASSRFMVSLLFIVIPSLVLLLPLKGSGSVSSTEISGTSLAQFIRGTQVPWYATPWWSAAIKGVLSLSLATQLYYPIISDGAKTDPYLSIYGMPSMTWVWGTIGLCLFVLALHRLAKEH